MQRPWVHQQVHWAEAGWQVDSRVLGSRLPGTKGGGASGAAMWGGCPGGPWLSSSSFFTLGRGHEPGGEGSGSPKGGWGRAACLGPRQQVWLGEGPWLREFGL